ncbi:AAA family ATPase [Clostridium sp. 'White wine YQ']|uniref:AAA family ATPase n=1 Tax=Clostridium sp. 'White wine YQ' TaxID=3027474 RepID=UPI002366ED24|nr:MoxR family ATPase [Clostridium sp. 'White wine YQ']MDD7792816.1 MoxR family ATPase [Clostridium sp. 'White wine YQ']
MNYSYITKIKNNLNKVILGKEKEINDLLKGVISGGHILIEDLPGLGKTTLVKALAKSLDLDFSRIQCTPDSLPSDILGVSIYNQHTGEFEFRKGPIFSNILLADELNRTSPKTQSALLEAMEEKQITEWRNSYKLESPFIVIATQNPLEYISTSILPQAQLDRFSIRISLGYPTEESEEEILKMQNNLKPLDEAQKVINKSEFFEIIKEVDSISIHEEIIKYIVAIANKTREDDRLLLGVSTRAALTLQKIAKASAYLNEREFVIPEDIKENIFLVFNHRVIPSYSGKNKEEYINEIMKDILNSVAIPKVI